jgi:hypothetical protein
MTVIVDGTNGITYPSVTTQNTAYQTRFKNRFINGNMAIDQRNSAASQTFTAAAALAYSVDRWYGYCTGANVTGQQIAGTFASSQYRYQFTGAASVTAIGFGQRIEAKNCYDLANQTATLSCYIANSLLTSVTWTASYATTTADTFGSLASPTVTQIATGTFTVTSTRTQYTTNISIPSAATTGIQIVFTVGAQISGTWVIDTVQLEVGSAASAFEYIDYPTQLAMCQRYFQANGGAVSNQILGVAWEYSTTGAVVACLFPVVMRTTPSLTNSAVSSWSVFSGGAGGPYAVTGIGLNRASPTSMSVEFTASSLTAGQAGAVLANNTTSARIFLSAEL